MESIQFGSIKSIALPSEWTADHERSTPIMTIRSCHPRLHNDVEINFFRRRQPLSAETMKGFRATLGSAHRIADGSEELKLLEAAMGNAGNNQWTNKNRGDDGPSFRLNGAETIQVQSRVVLLAKGTFIEPSTKKALNEYCGIFVDGQKEENVVEEVYLQVPSRYGYFQFEKYLKIFNELINSIEWA